MGGSTAECEIAADCLAPPVCVSTTCVEHVCSQTPLPAGSPVPSDVPNDCAEAACGPNGDVDVTLEPAGTRCSVDGGVICSPEGMCEPCVADEECAPEYCVDGACVASACVDGVRNAGESDIDCGGPCPACPLGASCVVPSDCAAGVCACATCYSRAMQCGDGSVDVPEGCDDGNLVDDDGCSAACAREDAPTNDGAVVLSRPYYVNFGAVIASRAPNGWYSASTNLDAIGDDGGSIWTLAGQPVCIDVVGVSDGVVCAAICSNGVSFGGEPLPLGFGIGKLGALDGHHLWSFGLATEALHVFSIGADAHDAVYAGVWETGVWELDGMTFGAEGQRDLALFKVNPGGDIDWIHAVPMEFEDQFTGLAVRADGHSVTSIAAKSDLDCGPQTLAPLGDFDIALIAHDESGNVVWCRRYGNELYQSVGDLTFDAEGNIYVVGGFCGTLTLGSISLPNKFGGDEECDNFVAKLDPSGEPLWAIAVGSSWEIGRLAVDCQGTVTFAGALTVTTDLGSGPMTPADGDDIFIARFDTFGHLLWSERFDPNTWAQPAPIDVASPSPNRFALGNNQWTPGDYGGHTANCSQCLVLATYSY